MAQSDLVNCKKCGTLFVKSSRDICESCLKTEVATVDKVKMHLQKSSKKLTLDDLAIALDIKKTDLEEMYEKGRFFSVLNKLLIKCKFCGIEIDDDNKNSFVCQKCLQKFSPKMKAHAHALGESTSLSVKIRRRADDPASKKTRYGFIQNYEL